MLTPARVHTIRTEPRPDPYYARLWNLHVQTIRAARVGDTWRDVPTPPDTAPRDHHGKWCGLTSTVNGDA